MMLDCAYLPGAGGSMGLQLFFSKQKGPGSLNFEKSSNFYVKIVLKNLYKINDSFLY